MRHPFRRPITKSVLILALLLATTTIDLTFQRSVCQPGDPPSSVWCWQESIGIHRGMIAIFSEDHDGSHQPSKWNLHFHPPAFHQPFVHTGWWDFWIIGIATWTIAAIALAIVWAWHLTRRDPEP